MDKQLNIIAEHTHAVLQHEWEVSAVASGKYLLGTTHVRWCTAFYGYDIDHTLGFLAHFDWPLSDLAVPKIFREIERQAKGRPRIKCFLIGGWKYSIYSDLTRMLIKKRINALNKMGWDIELEQKQFSNQTSDLQISFCTMPFQFDIRTGGLAPYSRHKYLRKKGAPLLNVLRLSAQRRYSGDNWLE